MSVASSGEAVAMLLGLVDDVLPLASELEHDGISYDDESVAATGHSDACTLKYLGGYLARQVTYL